MSPFRFRLEKVLAWRRTQVDLEEARFKQQMAAVKQLDRSRAELEAEGILAEVEVRAWEPLAGADLAALAGFRLHVRTQEKVIAARRAEAEKELDTRKNALLEARRRWQLIGRLKERHLANWQAACDRELEDAAAESHLTAVARRRASL